MYIGDPTPERFTKIFEHVCRQKDVPFVPGAVEYLYENVYEKFHLNVRSCHPRDLIEQVVSIAKYKGIPATLDKHLLDRACQTLLLC